MTKEMEQEDNYEDNYARGSPLDTLHLVVIDLSSLVYKIWCMKYMRGEEMKRKHYCI
jgi:hypothetical protein